MSKFVLSRNLTHTKTLIQSFSTSSGYNSKQSFKLVVLGGGAGGCSAAAKFASKLGKDQVAVIDPEYTHYYQPVFTLVGGGQKPLTASGRPMGQVLPKKAKFIQDKVVGIFPKLNKVTTKLGHEITYEYLVVALGIQLNYGDIKGLEDALNTPGVCSNYSLDHVLKTYKAIQDFKTGNAVFTFPNTPIKCAGAPQKIMYLTERVLKQMGKRGGANIMYETSLPVLFGVEKYADALWKLCNERDINVNLRSNLIEIKPDSREAIFEDLDKPENKKTVKYEMIHVTPPMSAPDVLRYGADKELVDDAGWLNVDKYTLQHVHYPNVFGIGDCCNVPTSKTAAAVAGEIGILKQNLASVMGGEEPKAKYDGYTSCPLITGPNECILAEFDFDTPPQPMETFPFNQAVPRKSMYLMKADIMPHVYWQMLKGRWDGPRLVRKLFHFGNER